MFEKVGEALFRACGCNYLLGEGEGGQGARAAGAGQEEAGQREWHKDVLQDVAPGQLVALESAIVEFTQQLQDESESRCVILLMLTILLFSLHIKKS